MPKKIEANGKVFEFDDNATDEQIGSALDEYFSSNPAEVKKKNLHNQVSWVVHWVHQSLIKLFSRM